MRKLEIKRTPMSAEDPVVNPLHETTVFELDTGNEERSIVVTMQDNETAVVTIHMKGDNVVYNEEQRAAMLVVGSGVVKENLPPPPATMSTDGEADEDDEEPMAKKPMSSSSYHPPTTPTAKPNTAKK